MVRLSAEERQMLAALISKGKAPRRPRQGWSDSRIVNALDVSPATIYRTRQQRPVEESFEAVLARKHSPNWPDHASSTARPTDRP
jgi:hypothetical protein